MSGQRATQLLDDAGPTVPVPTAAAVLGISPWLAYQLIKRGEAPFKVLRLGSRMRVSTKSLRDALGIDTAA